MGFDGLMAGFGGWVGGVVDTMIWIWGYGVAVLGFLRV